MEIHGDDPDMDQGKNTTPNQLYHHQLQHHQRQDFDGTAQFLCGQIYHLQQNGYSESKLTIDGCDISLNRI